MMSSTGKRSFTLIEVMVCVAVLSFGIIFLFRSFFSTLMAFNRYSDYLNVIPLMDEKMWRAQDEISRTANYILPENNGEFVYEGKTFDWQLSSQLIDQKQGLCRLDLIVSWQQQGRQMKLARYAYAQIK